MCLGSVIAIAMVYAKAAALIQLLSWELPYATGVAIKRKKKLQCYYHYTPVKIIKIKQQSFQSHWKAHT